MNTAKRKLEQSSTSCDDFHVADKFFFHRFLKLYDIAVKTSTLRFSVLLHRKNSKNATTSGQFGFIFDQNSVMEITWLSWAPLFSKGFIFKMLSDANTRKRKRRFQIQPVWEDIFEKLRFHDRLMWMTALTEEITPSPMLFGRGLRHRKLTAFNSSATV